MFHSPHGIAFVHWALISKSPLAKVTNSACNRGFTMDFHLIFASALLLILHSFAVKFTAAFLYLGSNRHPDTNACAYNHY